MGLRFGHASTYRRIVKPLKWSHNWQKSSDKCHKVGLPVSPVRGGAKRCRRELPDATEQQQEVRIILIRMMLDLHSLVTSQARPTEEMIVAFAIRLGQYEGKRLDASSIAAITTLPRTSVLRHLSSMQVKGRIAQTRVGRRIVYHFKSSSLETDAFFAGAEKVLRTAVRQLSKMDTLTSRHKR